MTEVTPTTGDIEITLPVTEIEIVSVAAGLAPAMPDDAVEVVIPPADVEVELTGGIQGPPGVQLVSSVHGRIGDVVAQAGDYAAHEVGAYTTAQTDAADTAWANAIVNGALGGDWTYSATVTAALATKAAAVHTHTLSDITDAGALAALSNITLAYVTDAGSAAAADIGTSGDAVPKLNAANTWSADQTHSAESEWGVFSATGATNGKRVLGDGSLFDSSRNTTAASTHQRFYNPNGIVGSILTNASATQFATSSDGQLKTNRTALRTEVSITTLIAAMNVQAFDWLRADGVTPTGERGHGLIAQELHGLISDAVSVGQGAPGDDDYVPWGIDYSKLVPYLVAALQEAFERIDALEQQVTP